MVTSTPVNGRMEKEQEEECRSGRTVVFTKDTGKTIRLRAMVGCYIPMEIYILENGKMIRLMDKALTFTTMAAFMKESGN